VYGGAEEILMQDVLIDKNRFIGTVSRRIHEIAAELSPENITPLDFHNMLQKKVADLGAEFGLRGVREYPVRVLPGGTEGLADVAWIAKRRLISVFEIDSYPKAKSLRKLLALDAPFRFWIYYGHQHYVSMVRFVDRSGSIEVIRLTNVYF
jgi:hypothetical protein